MWNDWMWEIKTLLLGVFWKDEKENRG